MKKALGKIWIYPVGALLLFTLAMLIECLLFQYPALRYKQRPLEIRFSEDQIKKRESLVELTEDEIRSIKVHRENQKLLAEYHGEEYEPEKDDSLVETEDTMYRKVKKVFFELSLDQPYYIHKISLRIPVDSQTGYRVHFVRDGVKAGEDIYRSIEPKTSYGIANAGILADKLEIEITTAEEISAQDILLRLSNNFAPNKMRIFFLFVAGMVLFFLFQRKPLLLEKPEWCFAILCFLLGSLLIFGIGTNQLGYDEYTHAKAAYKASFGTTIESTESVIQMCGNLLPFFSNPEERALVEAYEDKNHDYSWADIGHQSRIKRAENRMYYPMAAGFWLARKLHLGFAASVELAKFGNLLCYILIVFWAIRLSAGFGHLTAFIGLLPNCVFLASSLSYDPLVNSFLLLGYVLIVNELLNPQRKLSWQNALLILMSFFIGSISKPVYILMALMMIFFPKKKFHSGWQRAVFCLAVITVAGLMLYNIFRPTPQAGSDYYLVGNLSLAGDKRNVGTSVIGQLSYIMANPLTYTLLVLRSMWEMFAGYFFGTDRFLQYAYAGAAPKPFTYLMAFILIWLGLFREKGAPKRKNSIFYTALHIIMIFGMGFVLWSAMYVSYTSVASPVIYGVQGRYFIPLMLPFAFCLMNGRLESRLGEVGHARVVFAATAGVNLFMIWQYIITVMNV